MLQILELFGGIGSPRCALRNLGVPVKAIDYVEIDAKAVRSISTAYSYGGSLGLYEIALMKDGKIVKLRGKVEGFQDDDVLGYLTEDDVRKYIEILREFVCGEGLSK